ncbi:MAG: hypothetical protein KY469_18985 [Actinobacteria bacterium]|nr:hypothetical protein [Actinomycetota bacterium]
MDRTTPTTDQPTTRTASTSNGFSIGAIACGLLAFVIFPIVLGPIGIVLGAIAKSNNEPKANWGLGIAIAGTAIGMLLGFLVFANSGAA